MLIQSKACITLSVIFECIVCASRVPAQDAEEALPERAQFRLGDNRLRHRDFVIPLTFSPDGRLLASAGANSERGVRLWDVETGEQVAYLTANELPRCQVRSIAFSPDGKRLVAGAREGRVLICDIEHRTLLRTLEGNPRSDVRALAVSPDGVLFAAGDSAGNVIVRLTDNPAEPLWIQTDGEVRADPAFSRGVAAFAFSRDGNHLVAAMGDTATVLVLKPDTGELECTIPTMHGADSSSDHSNPLTSLVITPDGRWIITGGSRYVRANRLPREVAGGSDNVPIAEVRVWEMLSGKLVLDLMGEQTIKSFGCSALSPDGTTMACAHFSRIDLLRIGTGELVRSLPMPGWWGDQPVFSPDGRKLAAPDDNTIAVWDLATGNRLFVDRPGHDSYLYAVDYSSDGKLLATSDTDGKLHVWDAATGQHQWEASLGDGASIYDMQFSRDSRLIAACGRKDWHTGRPTKLVSVWSTDGRLLSTLHPERAPKLLLFFPQGDRLAVSVDDGDPDVQVWQIDPPRMLSSFRRDFDVRIREPKTLHISPDGRFVHFADYSGVIFRWDQSTVADNGSFLADWRTEEERTTNRVPRLGHASFTNDCKLLVSSTDNMLYVWDIEAGELHAEILLPDAPHGGPIAIAPDGITLAVSVSAPRNQEIRLFDLRTCRQISALSPGDLRATSFAFSPDSKRLISGFDNGTAMVWDLTLPP